MNTTLEGTQLQINSTNNSTNVKGVQLLKNNTVSINYVQPVIIATEVKITSQIATEVQNSTLLSSTNETSEFKLEEMKGLLAYYDVPFTTNTVKLYIYNPAINNFTVRLRSSKTNIASLVVSYLLFSLPLHTA